jgi:two-component system sensor histidine kinase/response regulator
MTQGKNLRVEKPELPVGAPGGDLVSLRRRVADLEAQLAAALREAGARRAVEAALERTEARSRALLESLLDPTVVIDDLGTIQAASDSVERVFLYAPQDLVGENIQLLMPEPHRSAHDSYLERYRRTGQTNILGRTREFEVQRKDGSRIICDLSVARAEMPGGQGALFVGSFRDVTERKRAEEAVRDSERRFRALFDRAFQFIGLLDPDGTLLEANQTACDAGGVTRQEVVGRPFWETRWWSHSKDMQQRIREAVHRAAAGEFVRFEISQRGRGHSILEVDFSLMPVKDEAGRVVLLIPEGRDMSELKAAQRAETAMLRALATIGESAAVLAHEIKNPITAVNVALRAVAGQLGEDHKAVLEDLVARMRHLEQLMRRTLSFAKPLELRRVECDAGKFLSDTIAHLRGQIVKMGAEVRAQVDGGGVRFIADPHLLEEVFSNLVVNAIEAKGGGVHVVLSAAASGRDGVLLSVEDDGPGIPESQRDSVFKPFVTTKPSGTGLGLAICKKIVEEHGGTIHVEEGSAGGARFVIRLKGIP